MNDNIVKFIKQAAGDVEILKKMQACANADEAYAVAKGYAGGFTQEEFVAAMKQINSSLTKADNSELSEEDLALVAGGKAGDPGFPAPGLTMPGPTLHQPITPTQPGAAASAAAV